ncbi:MAG: hypothetical protein A4E51_00673 [Methanosaeta sp. PtaU1.Bin055]|nr:MAG: hypothetical protein A4E51_00673 [Methanosaeta sp. PtaU1.Bin055]
MANSGAKKLTTSIPSHFSTGSLCQSITMTLVWFSCSLSASVGSTASNVLRYSSYRCS